MKKYLLPLILFVLLSPVLLLGKAVSVMVVTGGHPYDTPDFENMIESLKGIQVDFATMEEMEAMPASYIGKKYDALVLLDQMKAKVEQANKDRYMQLAEMGTGMVFLHFTIASRPFWTEYHDLIGGQFHLKRFQKDESKRSTYMTDMTIDVKVLDKKHPVTEGIKDFTMTDAFYGNLELRAGLTPLLGTDNPKVQDVIAWTHSYRSSKVVYMLPGFTRNAYENPAYRKFIGNAIKYVAQ